MITHTIGQSGIEVNAIGLGCMGLSAFYGPPTDTREAIGLLHAAIERGVNHFDTAEMYGMGTNEKLLGEAFEGRRDKVRVATKFGPLVDVDDQGRMRGIRGVDGSRENCRRAVENSLRFLRTEVIDLYYLHRADPSRPIEQTVSAMAELVEEGKVRALGLSEVSGDTLKRAHAVHPIAAVQSEYSIFSRDIERTLLAALKETGASLVAYAPLGRGLLAGRFSKQAAPGEGDFRASMPRFAGAAYEANLALADQIRAVAEARGVTPAQVALAWVLGRGDNILTIPGTTRLANLESNLAAADLELTDAERARLDALADEVAGDRYPPQGMAAINR